MIKEIDRFEGALYRFGPCPHRLLPNLIMHVLLPWYPKAMPEGGGLQPPGKAGDPPCGVYHGCLMGLAFLTRRLQVPRHVGRSRKDGSEMENHSGKREDRSFLISGKLCLTDHFLRQLSLTAEAL